ncbi:MAG TPA: FAD-dependent oxidoreductase, partial [Gammaproteobacteria bacterium]|nr:FAD-dependent oxidoreductase [Gammaproteobacteria bacterium]
MQAGTGVTEPVWDDRGLRDLGKPLDGNATADVCVVGAGIAGLSVAYALCREGLQVAVLDSRYPGA